jgi:hypothetical protein
VRVISDTELEIYDVPVWPASPGALRKVRLGLDLALGPPVAPLDLLIVD